MAGYKNFSMSWNAVDAYDEGLKPLSKIKAKDLKDAGITLSLKDFKLLVKAGYVHPTEWHHSSKMFNKTDFYDLYEAKARLEEFDVQRVLKELKTRQDSPADSRACLVEWVEWTGSRRHPKAINHSDKATHSGDWLYLENGTRKRADGNWIKEITYL